MSTCTNVDRLYEWHLCLHPHYDPSHTEKSAWYSSMIHHLLSRESREVEENRWFGWESVRGHAATSAVSH